MLGLLTDCIKVSEIATSKIITDILAAGCSLSISFKTLSNLCLALCQCVCDCEGVKQIKAGKVHLLLNPIFTYGRLFCLNWHEIDMRLFCRYCFHGVLQFFRHLLSICPFCFLPSDLKCLCIALYFGIIFLNVS